jgi:hypothetical protein
MRELIIATLLFTSALVGKVLMDDGPLNKHVTAEADTQPRRSTETEKLGAKTEQDKQRQRQVTKRNHPLPRNIGSGIGTGL